MDPTNQSLTQYLSQNNSLVDKLRELLENKRLLAVIGFSLILYILLLSGLASKQSEQNKQLLPPVPSLSPAPTAKVEQQPPAAVELQEAIAEQLQVDRDYADWQKDISESYPWRKKLPLTSAKYYVYFDLNKKVFIGRLYLGSSDDQELIKAEILKKLKEERGIPVESYEFAWEVFPQ